MDGNEIWGVRLGGSRNDLIPWETNVFEKLTGIIGRIPMLKIFTLLTATILFNSVCTAQSSKMPRVIRFNEGQVHFVLVDNDGESVDCTHQLLGHVPWWNVVCGNRQFTVNTWLQLMENTQKNKLKLTFMYDVSEGVKSSGEKLVQFHSHITTLIIEDFKDLQQLQSSLDVRNGLMSLDMTVDL